MTVTDPLALMLRQREEHADQLDQLLPHQRPPEGNWRGWVLLAGRDSGKTFGGARWLHNEAMSTPGLRCRIIAPTFGDAVASCVEGDSGIMSFASDHVDWLPGHTGGSILQWRNGSICYVLGMHTPRDHDRLRAIGNVARDWLEEAAAIPNLEKVVKAARFGLRMPGWRWIATTTPRPLKQIRAWNDDPKIAKTRATSHDNPHADLDWLLELDESLAGTRLHAQEVGGEIVEDIEGALWKFEWIARSRVALSEVPEIIEWAVGVDPANSTGTTGIIVVGLGVDQHLYVFADESVTGASSGVWARKATQAAAARGRCPLIPENDSGGDAIRGVLKAADEDAVVRPARARGRGSKQVRAEPVATEWEKDTPTAHMVGEHAQLEEELTAWNPDESSDSPDRLDALVHACTYLRRSGSWSEVEASQPARTNDRRGGMGATRIRYKPQPRR